VTENDGEFLGETADFGFAADGSFRRIKIKNIRFLHATECRRSANFWVQALSVVRTSLTRDQQNHFERPP
jgi:hypothetical protein